MSPRHERFCQEYVTTGNATKAYANAGYSTKGRVPGVMGDKLLKKAEIQARISEIQGKAIAKAEFSRDKTIQALVKIVESKTSKAVPTRDRIAAIRELCKILGHYTPIKVDVGIEAKLLALFADVTGAKR